MSFKRFLSPGFAAGLLLGIATTAAASTLMGSATFPDVQRGSYYDAAVGRLASQGVIQGMPDGRFHPGDLVSRADVAVMIDRAVNGANPVTPPVTVSSRASSARSVASFSSYSSVAQATAAGQLHFTTSGFNIGGAANTATLTVIRSGGSRGAIKVDYAFGGGTAVSGTDYDPSTGTISFADGEINKTISVHLRHQATQPTVTLGVTLSNPTNNSTLGTPSSATITLIGSAAAGSSSSSVSSGGSNSSGPAAGTLGYSATAYGVMENAGAITITVVRNGTAGAVTVNYATSDGSGKSGSDYNATNGTLSFANGEASRTFSVQVLNNSTVNGNKTIRLTLSAPTGGAVVGTPGTSVITIIDDENGATGSGSVQFSASTYRASKGADGKAVITVTRTGDPGSVMTVAYAASSGTATAAMDFTAVNGTLTFAAGETAKTFEVPLIKGTTRGTVAANLSLSSVTGGHFGDLTSATLTIDD
jgi:hypothetical protein